MLLKNFEIKLIFFVSVFLFFVKLFFSSNFFLIIGTCIFEIMTLILVFNLVNLIKINDVYLKAFLRICFFIFIVIDFVLNFSHSVYLDEAAFIGFGFSNLDFEIAEYFLAEVLSPLVVVFGFLSVFLIIFLAVFIPFKKKFKVRSKIFWVGFFVFYLILIFGFSVPNIYLNTISKEVSTFGLEKIELNYSLEKNYNFSSFERSFQGYDFEIREDKKVLVFVMESVNYEMFLRGIEENNERSFFNKVKNKSHIYSNYYTNNQDSLTSIFTMLNSKFIPFDAYERGWYERYGREIENEKFDLVDFFNSKNYSTSLFVSTTQGGEFGNFYNFDEDFFLLNYSKSKENFLCMKVFEFEEGCEDRVLFDNLTNHILDKKDENLFLFFEFIFGHSVKYNLESGVSSFEYYDEFLFDFYEFLENSSLEDEVTIVVLSDHGFRNLKDKSDLNSYKIPLVVVDSNLDFKQVNETYSHLDFKDILLYYLVEDYEIVSNQDFFIIGQTRSNLLGFNSLNSSFFVEDLESKEYLVYDNFNLSLDEVSNKLNYLENYKLTFQN